MPNLPANSAVREPSLRPTAEEAEIERIREEYDRRAQAIPSATYALTNAASLFMYMQRTRRLVHLFKEEACLPLEAKRICDVGCGKGDWLLSFLLWGARPSNLHGIELDEDRLTQARQRVPDADLRCGDARFLPWEDDAFDLVLQSTVFTSILNQRVKERIAGEMLRVLKPGGAILWYDFRYNNPRNPNVRGIEAGEIRRLFPGCRIRLQKVTLAPPITRRLVRVSWMMCLLLEKIPALRTHYLGVIRKVLPVAP